MAREGGQRAHHPLSVTPGLAGGPLSGSRVQFSLLRKPCRTSGPASFWEPALSGAGKGTASPDSRPLPETLGPTLWRQIGRRIRSGSHCQYPEGELACPEVSGGPALYRCPDLCSPTHGLCSSSQERSQCPSILSAESLLSLSSEASSRPVGGSPFPGQRLGIMPSGLPTLLGPLPPLGIPATR